jgi:hypothetical protein
MNATTGWTRRMVSWTPGNAALFLTCSVQASYAGVQVMRQ